MSKTLAVLAGLVALALPVAVASADDSATTTSASAACKAQRTAIGSDAFKALYGTNHNKSNALGKCVSKQTKVEDSATEAAKSNAAKDCKAEQALDPAAFDAKYGTNKNKSNAYGKCVSSKAKAQADHTIAAAQTATIKAAKACKTERSGDAAAFKAKYGTNKHKSNAFGKCVSAGAKAQS